MNYLSVCCIAKNEHPFIKEWINHHLLVGAEKIIIFDNDSSPSLKNSVQEYIDHGIVDFFEITGKEQQMAAYDRCLREYEKKSKWIAFIDVDEFIVPKQSEDVRLILTDYEDFGGLGVHWVEFGSSGYLTRPPQMQLQSYVQRFPLDYPKNMHIKSIVQPGRVKGSCDPHRFIYNEPWFCVDENCFPLAESQGPFTAKSIQLNHYYYRSHEDYCKKIERGRADRSDEAGKRKHDAFFQQLDKATVHDDFAQKFANKSEQFLDDFEFVKRLIKDRNDEKSQTKAYYDMVLKNIYLGKTDLAKHLVKKICINEHKKEIIDYINFEICKKNKNDKEALKYLHRLFQRQTDYSSCIDYAEFKISMKQTDDAKNMIKYIQSKFHDILKNDKDKSEYIKNLAAETGTP
ncbi:glycosyltransferase family 2 protein [Desulfomicrobium baculatum]|uniref:Glycosyl transferase family 2 n=1 Tax=Desulfomicrobium baculatum (strain DSM 4028 / VKM B-1378 / X) TaxID=525897 RepID=C7LT20_DESBD|nr:glycosyltransferase family 2 protein [Desulfomicrobium baculatum]ACU88244.1 protein of unknown function DUF23 [Desulfomicrobium baculatum DSM 4028]